jgi:hypothetical protein
MIPTMNHSKPAFQRSMQAPPLLQDERQQTSDGMNVQDSEWRSAEAVHVATR